MTKVKFLIDTDGKDVFAFFPEDNYTHSKTDGLFTCYVHVGQHSSCHIDYANECRTAKYNEYHDLLKELIGQGYNDLAVLNYYEDKRECSRPPTQGEIKFGEGATHYRTFLLNQIGHNRKGDIKKWFVAPDDKLRYYTN